MTTVKYKDQIYDCRSGETVLDALTRQGVTLDFSCRSGICQVCLQRVTSGDVPERSQLGLRPSLRAQGYFMPCSCVPENDICMAPPRAEDLYQGVVVQAVEPLTAAITKVILETNSPLAYRPGQFINLRRPDGLTRSYSLASVPDDYFLELHVQRKRNGVMSNWLCDELKPGDELELQGPQGECYYHADKPDQPILLIGTGSGLAPMFGVVRAALAAGHRGDIHLYHGTHAEQNLYLQREINILAARHANLHYHPCVSGDAIQPGVAHGRANAVAIQHHADLQGWAVYLCGLPAMVYAAQQQVLRAGADPHDIYADPFEMKDLRAEARAADVIAPTATVAAVTLAPDMELWHALRDGELLQQILAEFYTRVYADTQLSPFFVGVTRQRLIEKQYSFLQQHICGVKVYFGNRPRNAHHWMVISDELFDHREAIMLDCLQQYGVSKKFIERFMAYENHFRKDIVKTRPWNKVVNGVEMPLEGFGELALTAGSMCDSCGDAIDTGVVVRYHLRLGTVYCPACMGKTLDPRIKAGTHG